MNWVPIQTGWNNGFFETVQPQTIVRDQECQPRVNGTDPEVVSEYAADMREYDEVLAEKGIFGWQKFLRISCVKTDDGRHILVSGFHRLDAILQVGYKEIEIYCINGTRQDAILLSKSENADNGVRRTNADKAHVVKSCLLDDELKKWSNEQIAKWCGVAPQTVINHEERLSKMEREEGQDYERPAVRLYIKKDGTVGEKDTSEIGKRQKPKPNPEGCRKALKRTLSTQGMLNKSNVDTRVLSETYHLSIEEVGKLKGKVWTEGLAAAKTKHKTIRQCTSKEWLDWVELSDATTLGEVQDAACTQFAFLSKKTFDGSREKLAYVDYVQLQREIDQLEKFEECLIQRAGWLRALIAEPTSEDDEPNPVDLKSLWEQVTAEMKLWKQRDKEHCPNPEDAISRASKTMLITALRQSTQSDKTGAATADELKQLLQLMKSDDFGFTLRVRHVLKASQPQKVDKASETTSEIDEEGDVSTSEPDAHPVTRNLLIPDDPDNIKVCLRFSYPKANGFSHQVLGEELFELPRDVALPNDAAARNEAFATAFAVLKLLLAPTGDISELDEELIEEGVGEIDLHALNDTLSALLERLGADEMHHPFKESLTADLYDVFLQYENVPNAKEMLVALLNTADSILSELT